MTDNHPVTPSRELVQQWVTEIWHEGTPVRVAASDLHIAIQSARWGADAELEACCVELTQKIITASIYGADETEASWRELASIVVHKLRAARRPKHPSLRERALEALGPEPPPENSPTGDSYLNGGAIERHRTIRRALEALPE
jgi:hypothetical protein